MMLLGKFVGFLDQVQVVVGTVLAQLFHQLAEPGHVSTLVAICDATSPCLILTQRKNLEDWDRPADPAANS